MKKPKPNRNVKREGGGKNTPEGPLLTESVQENHERGKGELTRESHCNMRQSDRLSC